MPDLLTIEKLTAGYGEAVVLNEVSLALAEGQVAGAARPQRHGQDHADQLDRRRHALHRRHDRARRPRHHPRCAPTSAPTPASAGCRRSATSSSRSRSRRTSPPWSARAAGRWRAVYELFPRLRGAPAQPRQPALRRRAADAGGRPRAHPQSALMLLDEPLEGLAPILVEELLRRAAPHHPRRGHVGHPGRAERPEGARRHRPGGDPRARQRGLRGRQRRRSPPTARCSKATSASPPAVPGAAAARH